MSKLGILVPAILAILTLCGTAMAADTPAPTVIEVREVSAPPQLDGILNDACWQGLPVYTDFTDEDKKGIVKPATEVRMCCDAKNIYVAFHALCTNPKAIPAHEKKRNGSWRPDDCVFVDIDSSHQHRSYSDFQCNALGTQFDYLEGGSATNIRWRGDWHAAAKIVDDGYNVEMAIPFRLLKYDKGQQTFGICFERWLPKEQIWAGWPDVKGSWDVHLFADWKGVKAPYEKPRPVVLGYAAANADKHDHHVKTGFDVKYPITNDVLGLLTVKPDFSNIEQDVDSVDFSYTARYLPDRRPFFAEWEVGSPWPLFYSRMIGDFDLGTKLVGKSGRQSYELMNARAFGSESDTLLRYQHTIAERSYIDFGMVDHDLLDHRNDTTYLAGEYGWKRGLRNNYITSGLYTSTATGAPDGRQADIHWDTWGGDGSLGGEIRYARVDPTFNPELGFLPERDLQGPSASISWGKSYRNSRFQRIESNLSFENYDHTDGTFYRDKASLSGAVKMSGAYGMGYAFDKSRRDDPLGFFHDNTESASFYWNGNSPGHGGSLSYTIGRRANGPYNLETFLQAFKLCDGLILGTSYERSHVGPPSVAEGTARLFIGTISYDLTNEKSIGGRFVRRLGKQSMYFMYRQQLRRGTDIYVIFGDPDPERAATGDAQRYSIKIVKPLF